MSWLVWAAALLSVACGCDAARSGTSPQAAPSPDVRSPETTASAADQGGVDVFDAATPMRSASTVDAGAKRKSDEPTSSARTGSPTMDAGKPSTRASGQRAEVRDAGARPTVPSQSTSMLDAAAQSVDAEASNMGEAAVDAAPSDASASDAAPNEVDAGSLTTATAEVNTGSCCSTSTLPGCGDAALQACVCALKVSCCIEAWDESCTRLIAEKFCQSGVRDCVCGTDEGQWQQAQCCDASWDDTCNSVASNKCGATPDCQ